MIDGMFPLPDCGATSEEVAATLSDDEGKLV